MDIKEPGGYMFINERGDSVWHEGRESSESRAENWQSFIDENMSAW
jgi:hypothetical protein